MAQLGEAGTYQTACKPGMVGDGIRGDFKVTGDSVKIDGLSSAGLRLMGQSDGLSIYADASVRPLKGRPEASGQHSRKVSP